MNLYGIVAIMLLTIILGNFFQIQEPVKEMFEGVAEIFQFNNKGSRPELYDLAVFMCFLITAVGIIKVLVQGKGDE